MSNGVNAVIYRMLDSSVDVFNERINDIHIYLMNVSMVYAAECVSKIETILAIIFHSIYGAACLQLTQFACHDCENVYFILIS